MTHALGSCVGPHRESFFRQHPPAFLHSVIVGINRARFCIMMVPFTHSPHLGAVDPDFSPELRVVAKRLTITRFDPALKVLVGGVSRAASFAAVLIRMNCLPRL